MTLGDWLAGNVERYREDGPILGTTESLYELYIGALRRLNAVWKRGTNVYDKDWDVLVVLDGCRVDLMEEAVPEYDFLNSPDELRSVGSSSIEWLQETFTDDRYGAMQNTAYVTGNPFSHRVLDEGDLRFLDEVWRYAWDDDAGTIPARSITERAIDVSRTIDPDRLIVHYMQPHFPSVTDPLGGGMNADTLGEGAGWYDPWDRLRRGEITLDRVWESYYENLEYVLDEVSLLRNNVDANTVAISADHGNAAGERWVYGHPKVPHSHIRWVPWYLTSASDSGMYEPTLRPQSDQERSRDDLSDKLNALGYK